MANGIDYVSTWQFLTPCEPTQEIFDILSQGETVFASFRTVRDVASFTNKRLIVRDAQGLTGKKVEVFSIPWSSVIMWSSENAGKVLDINSEIELWTLIGRFKININKDINIREFDKLIANSVMK